MGSSFVNLQEENAATKKAYEVLLEEHNKLKKQHVEDSGKLSCLRLYRKKKWLDCDAFFFFSFFVLTQRRPRKLLMPRSRRMTILWPR